MGFLFIGVKNLPLFFSEYTAWTVVHSTNDFSLTIQILGNTILVSSKH